MSLIYSTATELSWTEPFVGDAAEALWHHIKEHHHQHPSGGSVYAHYAAVVQSSGMGKSRTVDEMGRKHFVIPINVRHPQSQGMYIVRSQSTLRIHVLQDFPPRTLMSIAF